MHSKRPRRHSSFIITLALMVFVAPSSIFAQQPSPAPSPQRTGRSYDVGASAPQRPPAPGPQAPSPVTFTDITAQTRIDFKHVASFTSQKYLPESMGGGVALFDYDADGRLDLYF